ncbi:MAG: flagellar biosynthetic protein [Sphingomonadaceae bacterium]|nr:flagellar biosynthetic protein [Sphingomonadaceae bacterium]
MSEIRAISLTDIPVSLVVFTARRRGQPAAAAPDPVDAGYHQGFADGQLLAETAFALEREQLHRLIASADAIRAEDNPDIAFLLANTVRKIVHDIVGEISCNPLFLTKQIESAVAILVDADQARTICLHPDDVALLADAPLPLPCKADPALERGAIRIECSSGWVEHGPAFLLQRLDQLLPHSGGAQ